MPGFRQHRTRGQAPHLLPQRRPLPLREPMRLGQHHGVGAPELPGRLSQQSARQQMTAAERAKRIQQHQVQVLHQPPVLERVVQDACAHAKALHRGCR